MEIEDRLKRMINYERPWETVKALRELFFDLLASLEEEEYEKRSESVWIHRTAKVDPTAFIGENCIIGAGTQVRQGAYLRGLAVIAEGCVIGNSTEIKNSLLFGEVKLPHFNYVGDSILCHGVHFGAGAIASNVKADGSAVVVKDGEKKTDTGMRKFGAFVGAHAEIGCNCVLNPGSVIGERATVYPLSFVRGVVPPNSLYKKDGIILPKR